MVKRSPPMSPGFCRVAAVQLDFHAAARLHGTSPLGHPLGDAEAGPLWGLGSALPAHLQRSFRLLKDRVRALYLHQLERRLDGVLSFLADLDVEVVVLPEYAVPPELLAWLARTLARLAPEMLVVAGTHGVAPGGDEADDPYHASGYDGPTPTPGTAVAPVFVGGKLVALLPKLALTDLENRGSVIVPAADDVPQRVVPWAPGREAWVAICRDFLEAGRNSVPSDAKAGRLLLVPALTPERSVPDEFEAKLKDAVRRAHCPVAFANRAADGGTRVWPLIAGGLTLDAFPPLVAHEEGLVVVDVDLNPYPGAATAPFPARPQARQVCTTGCLYVARASDAAHAASVAEGLQIETPAALARWLQDPGRGAAAITKGRRERWSALAANEGFLNLGDAHALMHEVVFEADILPLDALERALALGAADALRPLEAGHPQVEALTRALRDRVAKHGGADTPEGAEAEQRIRRVLTILDGHFTLTAADSAAFDALANALAAGDYANAATQGAALLPRADLGPSLQADALYQLASALYGTVWEIPGNSGTFTPILESARGTLVDRACTAARGLESYGSAWTGDPTRDPGQAAMRSLRSRLVGVVHDQEAVGADPAESLTILVPPHGGPWRARYVAAANTRDIEALRTLHAEFPAAMPIAFLLADCAEREGLAVEGLAAARRAFALLPGMGQRLKLAELLTTNGLAVEAQQHLEAVEATLPPAGRLMLANARALQGDDKGARVALDAQLAAHPDDLATRLQAHHLSRHREEMAEELAWQAFDAASPEARAKVPPSVYQRLADQLRASMSEHQAAELRRRLRALADVLSNRVPSFEVDVALLTVASGLTEEVVEGLRRIDLERYTGRPELVVGHGVEGFETFLTNIKAHHDRVGRLHEAGLISFEALGEAQPRVWFERAAAVFRSDGALRFPASPGRLQREATDLALHGPLLLGPLEVLILVESGVRPQDFAALLGPGPRFALFEDTLSRLHQGGREVLDAALPWRGDEAADALADLARRVREWLASGVGAKRITVFPRTEVDTELSPNLPHEIRGSLRRGLERWEALAVDSTLAMAVADEVEIGRTSPLSPLVALPEAFPDSSALLRRISDRYLPCADRIIPLVELLVRAEGKSRRPRLLVRLAGWGLGDALLQTAAGEALVLNPGGLVPEPLLEAHEEAVARRVAWAGGGGRRPFIIDRVLHYGALFTALAAGGRESAALALLDRAERLDARLRGALLGTLVALKTVPVDRWRASRQTVDRWCEGRPERLASYRLATRLVLPKVLESDPRAARSLINDLFAAGETSVSSAFSLDGFYERALLWCAWPETGPLPTLGGVSLEEALVEGVDAAVADSRLWRVVDHLVAVQTDSGQLRLPSAAILLRVPAVWAQAHGPTLADAARPLDGQLADCLAAVAEAPDNIIRRERLARGAIGSTARLCARSPQALEFLAVVLGRTGTLDTMAEVRALLSEPPDAVPAFDLRAALEARVRDPRWRATAAHELLLRATALPWSRAVVEGTSGWVEQGTEAADDALEALRYPERLSATDLTRFLFVAGRVAARETWLTLGGGEVVELRPLVVDKFVALLTPDGRTVDPVDRLARASTEAPLARLALQQLATLRRRADSPAAGDAELLYLANVLRGWMNDILADADEGARRHFLEALVANDHPEPSSARHVLNPVAWGGPEGLDLRTASVLLALVALTMPREGDAPGPWLPVRSDLLETLLALASRPLTAIERQLRRPTAEDRALGVTGPVAVPDLALFALARLEQPALGRLAPDVRNRLLGELPRHRDDRDGAPWMLVLPTLLAALHAKEPTTDPDGRLAERVATWLNAGIDDFEVALAAVLLSAGGDEADATQALGALVHGSSEGREHLPALLTHAARLGAPFLTLLLQRLIGLGLPPGDLALRLAAVAVDPEPALAETARAALLELARDPALGDDERVVGLLRALGLTSGAAMKGPKDP